MFRLQSILTTIWLFASILMSSCQEENLSPLMSCSNDDGYTKSSYVVATNVNFSISNQNGEDLLNPTTKGYFSDIQFYYLLNGKKIKAKEFDPQIGGDNGKGIALITETQPYYLKCFTHAGGDEGLISEENCVKIGISIAYIQLNKQITDTIKTEWESRKGKYRAIRKI